MGTITPSQAVTCSTGMVGHHSPLSDCVLSTSSTTLGRNLVNFQVTAQSTGYKELLKRRVQKERVYVVMQTAIVTM
jgi:hypothetical protein